MKAITIKQPWASLIAAGLKDIENRTWSCPKKYLGKRVLIHAAKTSVKEGWSALNGMQIKKVSKHKDKLYGDNEDLPKGAIIGSVEIVDCVQNHPSPWAEKGVWNWVLANPVMFDEPITGVKGKLSFWEYNGELPKPKQEEKKQPEKPVQAIPDMKELQEKAFRESVSESTKKMMERLTIDEQMRVSFVPLIITQLAWTYADKAMKCAARDKVSILKKLSRNLKEVKQAYDNELKRELDYDHFKNIERQSDMCITEMDKDLTILYFCVNQEFKHCAPEYPYDELRTYAIMSILFVNFLRLYNLEIDKMLAVKLNDRNLIPSIVPPLIEDLRTIMYAFAGVDGKFNFKDKNVKLAISAIWNRINSIKFSIFD